MEVSPNSVYIWDRGDSISLNIYHHFDWHDMKSLRKVFRVVMMTRPGMGKTAAQGQLRVQAHSASANAVAASITAHVCCSWPTGACNLMLQIKSGGVYCLKEFERLGSPSQKVPKQQWPHLDHPQKANNCMNQQVIL